MILGHGSGADEAVFLLAPLLVVGGMLWWANRVGSRADQGGGEEAGSDE